MERRTDQYDFTREYDKTFITGNLKGITIHVKYGTCWIAPPYEIKDGMILTDAITKDQSVVSNHRDYRNY